jgi:hypothetical protein
MASSAKPPLFIETLSPKRELKMNPNKNGIKDIPDDNP